MLETEEGINKTRHYWKGSFGGSGGLRKIQDVAEEELPKRVSSSSVHFLCQITINLRTTTYLQKYATISCAGLLATKEIYAIFAITYNIQNLLEKIAKSLSDTRMFELFVWCISWLLVSDISQELKKRPKVFSEFRVEIR